MRHYKEYIEDLLTKDLTTPDLSEAGISIIQVKCFRNIDFEIHKHRYMNQTIRVIEGELYDIQDEKNIKTYKKGDCLFVPKNTNHRFRYCKDSELLVVFIPGLKNLSKKLKTRV